MTGKIFSIEEFSTFDGPGMRCTIFMKGCPLRCQWCHNPEGQSFDSEIVRSPNGCIRCGTCERTGLTTKSIALCPQHLLRICGEEYTPQELIAKISPQIDMLKLMEGGITFSGGEPLSQSDFVIECLKLLNGRIHRAVQTSGFCSKEAFLETLKHVDFVLFDLKHMDSAIHKYYTGIDNTLILSNYTSLANSNVDFITRIPLIPGVNDTTENIIQTAKFMKELGVHRIELLPYNKAAGAKYKSLGRQYRTDFDGSIAPNTHIEIFQLHDIEVKVI